MPGHGGPQTPPRPTPRRFRRLPLAVLILALAAAPAAAARTGAHSGRLDETYALAASALLGPAGTDVYLTVTSATEPVPDRFEKVQVKTLPFGENGLRTENFFDVPAPGGVAVVRLSDPVRNQRLHVLAHVKQGQQHNVEAEAEVRLRPDLAVARVSIPDDVVRGQPFALDATIVERATDTGADATVSVYDSSMLLASRAVSVAAGSSATVSFELRLRDVGSHSLRVEIVDASPAESDTSNNGDDAEIAVHRYDADGAVTTDHVVATRIGADILRAGGNAIDAAVAVQFALNVTQPHLNGIGGGANIVVRLGNGERFAIDAREIAPAATTRDMYTGKTFAVVTPNGFSVGVPGTLRGVEVMLERWGTMSLSQVLQPAIELAEGGFAVGPFLANDNANAVLRARFQPETRAIFSRSDGTPLQLGDTLVQPDLAKTFRLIARDGSSVFYRGEIAAAIVAAQRRAQIPGGEGRMTLDDLAAHEVEVETPVSLDYRGYEILGAPPSTNGGLIVLEALGLLERFPVGNREAGYGFGEVKTLHLMLEAMRLALADRDWWMGDDEFFPVPVSGLLSDAYLAARSGLISETARIPGVPAPGNPGAFAATDGEAATSGQDGLDVGHTTHFSIIDKWGNVVSATSSLTDSFGSGITVPGYGFLLNNHLANFNLTPRSDPATGNPGANDPAGGKRPMGNHAPVVIVKDGEPVAATGTFGGAFIPSVVFNVVLNLIDHRMTLQQAVDAPRIWIAQASGAAAVNAGLLDAVEPLRAMGHGVARQPGQPTALGSTSSIGVDLDGFVLQGAADKRRADASSVIVARE